VKSVFVVGEETMGLVASVILSAETPVNVRKDCLVFIVYRAKDAAAYFLSLLTLVGDLVKKGVYQLLVHIWLKSMAFLT
jgi:hypothetical protein